MLGRGSSSKVVFRSFAALWALAFASLSASSCTLIVDSNSDQCKQTSDCSKFPGTTCQQGVCVGATGCTSTAECLQKNGDYNVCRKTNNVGTCVSLLSAECTTVFGDYKNDAAIFIGSVLPTTGGDKSTGLASQNSVELAIKEIQSVTGDLPPAPGTTARRPLVLVGCSDNSDGDTAVKAATHLAVDVKVPAIVGAAFSGITIKTATNVTIPNNVLLFSPSATSVAITALQDNGLVWRTSPSDILQAQAIALYVTKLELQVRAENMLMPSDKITVAIVHKGDAYGAGLGKALEQKLVFNGVKALDAANASYYSRSDFGDPDNAQADPPKYAQVVTDVLKKKPHIVLDFGTNESILNVLQPIEDGWNGAQPTVSYRAHFVTADGGLIPELWDKVVAKNDGLRKRITGTVPGTNNDLFKAFKSSYSTQFKDGTSPDAFGAAGSYDILYLLAYSIVANGSTPITGPSLAAGLAKMVPPGDSIDVGGDGVNMAFPVLTAGKNIDFNGASGPLDFDLATGEAPSDIQIWCMPKDPNGAAQSGIGSGLFYNAKTNKLEGTVGALCD
jgi:branched-chain amino acid transport system substrate-binding protein